MITGRPGLHQFSGEFLFCFPFRLFYFAWFMGFGNCWIKITLIKLRQISTSSHYVMEQHGQCSLCLKYFEVCARHIGRFVYRTENSAVLPRPDPLWPDLHQEFSLCELSFCNNNKRTVYGYENPRHRISSFVSSKFWINPSPNKRQTPRPSSISCSISFCI